MSDDTSLETLELAKAEMTKLYDEQIVTNRTFAALQSDMKKAARIEDFETAANLKKEITSIQRRYAETVERVRQLRDRVRDIHEVLCKQRFKARPSSSGVTLTRVIIGRFNDPDQYHELFYIHPDEKISLSFRGVHFDSEAYRLYDWAIENNLAFYSEQFDFTGAMINAFEPST